MYFLGNQLFSRKINVSFVTLDCLRGLHRLGEASRNTEWVGTSLGSAVNVLALEMLSVNSHGYSLGVISLGHAALQLFIGSFLGAAIHASFHNQLLVTKSHRHLGTILGLHDFAADLID